MRAATHKLNSKPTKIAAPATTRDCHDTLYQQYQFFARTAHQEHREHVIVSPSSGIAWKVSAEAASAFQLIVSTVFEAFAGPAQ